MNLSKYKSVFLNLMMKRTFIFYLYEHSLLKNL